MSGRRVLVIGLPFFGTRVAESLNSVGYEARTWQALAYVVIDARVEPGYDAAMTSALSKVSERS